MSKRSSEQNEQGEGFGGGGLSFAVGFDDGAKSLAGEYVDKAGISVDPALAQALGEDRLRELGFVPLEEYKGAKEQDAKRRKDFVSRFTESSSFEALGQELFSDLDEESEVEAKAKFYNGFLGDKKNMNLLQDPDFLARASELMEDEKVSCAQFKDEISKLLAEKDKNRPSRPVSLGALSIREAKQKLFQNFSRNKSNNSVSIFDRANISQLIEDESCSFEDFALIVKGKGAYNEALYESLTKDLKLSKERSDSENFVSNPVLQSSLRNNRDSKKTSSLMAIDDADLYSDREFDSYNLVTQSSYLTMQNVDFLLQHALSQNMGRNYDDWHKNCYSKEFLMTAIGSHSNLKSGLRDAVLNFLGQENPSDNFTILMCSGDVNHRTGRVEGNSHWTALNLRLVEDDNGKKILRAYFANSLLGDSLPYAFIGEVLREVSDLKKMSFAGLREIGFVEDLEIKKKVVENGKVIEKTVVKEGISDVRKRALNRLRGFRTDEFGNIWRDERGEAVYFEGEGIEIDSEVKSIEGQKQKDGYNCGIFAVFNGIGMHFPLVKGELDYETGKVMPIDGGDYDLRSGDIFESKNPQDFERFKSFFAYGRNSPVDINRFVRDSRQSLAREFSKKFYFGEVGRFLRRNLSTLTYGDGLAKFINSDANDIAAKILCLKAFREFLVINREKIEGHDDFKDEEVDNSGHSFVDLKLQEIDEFFISFIDKLKQERGVILFFQDLELAHPAEKIILDIFTKNLVARGPSGKKIDPFSVFAEFLLYKKSLREIEEELRFVIRSIDQGEFSPTRDSAMDTSGLRVENLKAENILPDFRPCFEQPPFLIGLEDGSRSDLKARKRNALEGLAQDQNLKQGDELKVPHKEFISIGLHDFNKFTQRKNSDFCYVSFCTLGGQDALTDAFDQFAFEMEDPDLESDAFSWNYYFAAEGKSGKVEMLPKYFVGLRKILGNKFELLTTGLDESDRKRAKDEFLKACQNHDIPLIVNDNLQVKHFDFELADCGDDVYHSKMMEFLRFVECNGADSELTYDGLLKVKDEAKEAIEGFKGRALNRGRKKKGRDESKKEEKPEEKKYDVEGFDEFFFENAMPCGFLFCEDVNKEKIEPRINSFKDLSQKLLFLRKLQNEITEFVRTDKTGMAAGFAGKIKEINYQKFYQDVIEEFAKGLDEEKFADLKKVICERDFIIYLCQSYFDKDSEKQKASVIFDRLVDLVKNPDQKNASLLIDLCNEEVFKFNMSLYLRTTFEDMKKAFFEIDSMRCGEYQKDDLICQHFRKVLIEILRDKEINYSNKFAVLRNLHFNSKKFAEKGNETDRRNFSRVVKSVDFGAFYESALREFFAVVFRRKPNLDVNTRKEINDLFVNMNSVVDVLKGGVFQSEAFVNLYRLAVFFDEDQFDIETFKLFQKSLEPKPKEVAQIDFLELGEKDINEEFADFIRWVEGNKICNLSEIKFRMKDFLKGRKEVFDKFIFVDRLQKGWDDLVEEVVKFSEYIDMEFFNKKEFFKEIYSTILEDIINFLSDKDEKYKVCLNFGLSFLDIDNLVQNLKSESTMNAILDQELDSNFLVLKNLTKFADEMSKESFHSLEKSLKDCQGQKRSAALDFEAKRTKEDGEPQPKPAAVSGDQFKTERGGAARDE